MFEHFFTTPHPVTGRRGTGPGRAIATSLVTRAQGRITLHSRPGEGTAPEVRFPPPRAETETAESGAACGIDTTPGPFYPSVMDPHQTVEDRQIRRLLIIVPTLAVLGFLATAGLATILISANFNPMNWLE